MNRILFDTRVLIWAHSTPRSCLSPRRTPPKWNASRCCTVGPFDRLLAGQAAHERLTLLTADERLLAYPLDVEDARV